MKLLFLATLATLFISGSYGAICNGSIPLTNLTGTFSTSPEGENYPIDHQCDWMIMPANSNLYTTIQFQFQFGEGDYVLVYFDNELYHSYNGTDTTGTVNSPNGTIIKVVFVSDHTATGLGLNATYSMTYCSGTMNITGETGVISDESGDANYTDNSNCRWLIQGLPGKSIILTFTSFSTESTYDGVEVFDGYEFNAPSLGFFSGKELPPQLNGTAGKSMFLTFTSDESINDAGWSASFSRVEVSSPSSTQTTSTESTRTSSTDSTRTSVSGTVSSASTGSNVVPNYCRDYTATGLPLAVPPSDTETQTNSTINVPDTFPVYQVDVLNVTGNHSYIGDLIFYLESPDGERVLLSGRTCEASDQFEISWSDTAPSDNWPCPPEGGIYRPAEYLSIFNSKSSKGQWKLVVDDSIAEDSGILEGWQLRLCTVRDNSGTTEMYHSDSSLVFPAAFFGFGFMMMFP